MEPFWKQQQRTEREGGEGRRLRSSQGNPGEEAVELLRKIVGFFWAAAEVVVVAMGDENGAQKGKCQVLSLYDFSFRQKKLEYPDGQVLKSKFFLVVAFEGPM